MKIIAPIKVVGLTVSIDIIDLSTGNTVETGTMTEISYGHYLYDFVGYVQGTDYFIHTQDALGENIYETTTGEENLIIDNIIADITESEAEIISNIGASESTIIAQISDKIDTIDWTVNGTIEGKSPGVQYVGGGDVIGGISIEQLNTSVERILGMIERSRDSIKEDIKDNQEGLLDILADLDTAFNLKSKGYIDVGIDTKKIIDAINNIKTNTSDNSIKGDIRELIQKMDGYKQLDISDITEAIIANLNDKITNDNKDIILSIKNNFKDLNNKIKDLKEFNDKIDAKDRNKVIEDTYKILENIESSGIDNIVSKLSSISNRINLMHEDILLYNE